MEKILILKNYLQEFEILDLLKKYFGEDQVVPLYVEVEDGLRLERALSRERMQDEPDYAELCRRYLSDRQDFSEEKLREAGITRRYVNEDADRCAEEVWKELCRRLDLNR